MLPADYSCGPRPFPSGTEVAIHEDEAYGGVAFDGFDRRFAARRDEHGEALAFEVVARSLGDGDVFFDYEDLREWIDAQEILLLNVRTAFRKRNIQDEPFTGMAITARSNLVYASRFRQA